MGGTRAYDGIRDCVVKTYRDAGIRGFFPGMASTLIRSFPVNAVVFSVVTWILRLAAPLEQQEGSVTYQKDASALHTFSQDHQINTWTAEWNRLGFHVVLTNAGSSTPLLRNYSMQYADIIAPFLRHSRPSPTLIEDVKTMSRGSCNCKQESAHSESTIPHQSVICSLCHKVALMSTKTDDAQSNRNPEVVPLEFK